MYNKSTVTSQNLGRRDGVERRERDRQADAGWVVFWNVRVYSSIIPSIAVCFLVPLLFSWCYRCYRHVLCLDFLIVVSFLCLSQLFLKRFHLSFVRHTTRITKAQLGSRGDCFACHFSYTSISRVHGSSKFRSRKQSIRVCFLKALDLRIQLLEDFEEKFPSTLDARESRFRFGCFCDCFIYFRDERRNEPIARIAIIFVLVLYRIFLLSVPRLADAIVFVEIIQVVLSSFVKRRQEGREYVW